MIEAGGVGGGGVDGVAAGIPQVDGDVLDPGLASILDAVGVGVIPDEVAEGGDLIESGIQGEVISRRR